MHRRTRWGGDGHTHWKNICPFVKEIGAKTILDYGCGRGTLKKKIDTSAAYLKVFEYDPGIPGKDKSPDKSDLVVCTDVLEHIEDQYIDNVLGHINDLSIKGAYFVISCRKANASLPDGRNAHLIIQKPQWWIDSIKRHFEGRIKFDNHPKVLKAWIQK